MFFIVGLLAPSSSFRALHRAFDFLKNLFRENVNVYRHVTVGSENFQASQLLCYLLHNLGREFTVCQKVGCFVHVYITP